MKVRGRAGERGSSLVEFAIVTTCALTLLFGVIDFGRALYTYHLVTDAARYGTRYAIVHGSACTAPSCPATAAQIQTYVRGLAPGIDPNAMTVTTTWASGTGCSGGSFQGPGCLATVQVRYTFAFVAPLMPSFSLPMTSTSQMVISQ